MNRDLTVAERLAIRAIAAGDTSPIELARRGFDRIAPQHGLKASPELQFMSEVVSPSPDPLLLERYRKSVLDLPAIEVLTPDERLAIRGLAGGDKSQLEAARRAFHRAAPSNGVDACVELQFMSEMLAGVPDLLLRAQYRKAVLQQRT